MLHCMVLLFTILVLIPANANVVNDATHTLPGKLPRPLPPPPHDPNNDGLFILCKPSPSLSQWLHLPAAGGPATTLRLASHPTMCAVAVQPTQEPTQEPHGRGGGMQRGEKANAADVSMVAGGPVLKRCSGAGCLGLGSCTNAPKFVLLPSRRYPSRGYNLAVVADGSAGAGVSENASYNGSRQRREGERRATTTDADADATATAARSLAGMCVDAMGCFQAQLYKCLDSANQGWTVNNNNTSSYVRSNPPP